MVSTNAFTDETWTFDIDSTWTSGTWTQQTPPTAPPARYYGVSGLLPDGSFIIATGQDASGFYNDAWTYNAGSWAEIPGGPNLPDARYGSAGGVIGNALYVSHGFASERYSDTWRVRKVEGWERRHNSISEYSPDKPHPRCLVAHSAPAGGSKFVMFGGCANGGKTGGPCPALDTWVFDEANDDANWVRGQDNKVPLQHGAMASFDGSVHLLYGGSNSKPQVVTVASTGTDSAFLFNDATGDWTAVSMTLANNTPSIKQQWHVMAHASANRVIVVGIEGANVGVWVVQGDHATAAVRSGLDDYWSLLHIHGIFMFMAWGVLIQFGSFMFRYFRHVKWAFMAHQVCNFVGVIFTLIGFALAFAGGGSPKFAHGGIGIVVFILALLQPISAIFRCHKPDDDGNPVPNAMCGWGWEKRWIYNLFHQWCGRLALVLGLANITLGIPLIIPAEGDVWPLWSAWFAWMALILLSYAIAEILICAKVIPKFQRTPEEKVCGGARTDANAPDQAETRALPEGEGSEQKEGTPAEEQQPAGEQPADPDEVVPTGGDVGEGSRTV
eukprot:TRINITY_DN8555_c0_g1_i1.p1 TRINITY_DN8555_c0_g1~~TRINITY_DN8555_c0_g1_i1.p1  ORF type:complete len:634 (+),score=195.46 TRINITY_DN8555_c0_g1_i1:239-1903(+)